MLNTLGEVDIVLYLIDLSRPPGEEERHLMELLKDYQERLIIGLNKIDLKSNCLNQIKGEITHHFREPRSDRAGPARADRRAVRPGPGR
ncbi:hypothetical protein ES703_83003 [subsurface metagenome]